jgi:hypothetical protein
MPISASVAHDKRLLLTQNNVEYGDQPMHNLQSTSPVRNTQCIAGSKPPGSVFHIAVGGVHLSHGVSALFWQYHVLRRYVCKKCSCLRRGNGVKYMLHEVAGLLSLIQPVFGCRSDHYSTLVQCERPRRL